MRAHEAGRSAHFRLFIGDSLETTTPAEDVLAALETNWADTKTMLGMPEGRRPIDYYILRDEEVGDACDLSDAEGCEVEGRVYTYLDVHQHELNHAYMELLAPHAPAPLLVEGIAEAVGCAFPTSTGNAFPDWRTVVSYEYYGAVYDPGRTFVRHLISRFGAADVVRYYAQAPNTRDPDAFGDNFAAFWGTDLDSVWSEAGRTRPAWGTYPLCPCSVPPWSGGADPTLISETSQHPYWTWPDVGGDTTAFSGYLGSVYVSDCQRELFTSTIANVMFAKLQGPYYALISRGTVARGPFLSETCEEASPYPLDTGLITVDQQLHISISVPKPTADAPVHLAMTAPEAGAIIVETGIGNVSICPSCDFAAPDCQAATPSVPVPVPPAFHIRWDVPTGALNPAVVSRAFAWTAAAAP